MHVPYDAPPEWEVLQPAEPGQPDAIFDNYCTGSATPTPYENARCHYGSSERCPHFLVICDQVANLKGILISVLKIVDEGMVNVTGALRQRDRWEDTLMILSADNGSCISAVGLRDSWMG